MCFSLWDQCSLYRMGEYRWSSGPLSVGHGGLFQPEQGPWFHLRLGVQSNLLSGPSAPCPASLPVALPAPGRRAVTCTTLASPLCPCLLSGPVPTHTSSPPAPFAPWVWKRARPMVSQDTAPVTPRPSPAQLSLSPLPVDRLRGSLSMSSLPLPAFRTTQCHLLIRLHVPGGGKDTPSFYLCLPGT